jgi:hypothetical protein
MKTLGMEKAEDAEEGMGPMDKGRHRYAKGDYAGALAAFTQVSTSPSLFSFPFTSDLLST